ncbi:ferrous iron transport protein A [Synechococcus sp. CS-1329]|uniref:FeoA family protein n=1 Tax=Synechococcus sp. CS-1329 TaxID=2847975 RepID=UPI00223C27D9|nr:ferrous iron transport protein A [Synechococcus sp. CS-1329]MCT0219776.1 ferrous iron transport protein A [Synechococcus sp. CS-1329]
MNLADAPLAQPLELLTLPSRPGLEARLRAMGVKPGCQLLVMRRGSPGGILHLRMGLLDFMLRRSDGAEMEALPLSLSPDRDEALPGTGGRPSPRPG